MFLKKKLHIASQALEGAIPIVLLFIFFSRLWNASYRSSIVRFAAIPLGMPEKPKFSVCIPQIMFFRFMQQLEIAP